MMRINKAEITELVIAERLRPYPRFTDMIWRNRTALSIKFLICLWLGRIDWEASEWSREYGDEDYTVAVGVFTSYKHEVKDGYQYQRASCWFMKKHGWWITKGYVYVWD